MDMLYVLRYILYIFRKRGGFFGGMEWSEVSTGSMVSGGIRLVCCIYALALCDGVLG